MRVGDRFELPADDGTPLPAPGTKERSALDAKRDSDYCLALLEETGICVVPGSGFGQEPGTLHFRTTFLPPEAQIARLVERLGSFHKRYTLELAKA